MDPRAIRFHPLAIARGHLVGECRHHHVARRSRCATARRERQLHLGSGLVDQQRLRRSLARGPLPVHRNDPFAGLRLDAHRIERRIGAGIPWVAGHDARDLVAAVVDRAQVGSEIAERDLRRAPIVAAHFVGVRRPQLALHFPDEVGQFSAGRHPIDERRVAAIDGVPIDARHVRHPELVALQAPDLAQHLPPLAARLDRQPNAIEVEPATLARRFLGGSSLAALALGLARRRDRAQALALADDERRVIAGDRETVGLFHQRFDTQGFEFEHFEPAGRILVSAASVCAGDRQHRPHDPATPRARDLAEAVFGNGERRDPAGDAVEIDRRHCTHVRCLAFLARILGSQALRRRVEWRPPARLQRDQVRPRAAGKAQLELDAVVDRIERAHRQEVEVAPFGIECRAVIAKFGLGDERARLSGEAVELDRGVPRGRPERIGEPGSIGRPCEVLGTTGIAAIDRPSACRCRDHRSSLRCGDSRAPLCVRAALRAARRRGRRPTGAPAHDFRQIPRGALRRNRRRLRLPLFRRPAIDRADSGRR